MGREKRAIITHLFDVRGINSFCSFLYHLQEEVFNILFIKEQEKRHVVHCMSCARKQSPNLQGFVCLEEYKISELMQVYDAFVFHRPPPQPLFLQPNTPQSLPTQQQQPTPPLPSPSHQQPQAQSVS